MQKTIETSGRKSALPSKCTVYPAYMYSAQRKPKERKPFEVNYLSHFAICIKIELGLESFARKRRQFHQVLVEEDDSLHHLTHVLENAPSQHHFAHLDELQAETLTLELVIGLGGLFVGQSQLRVLRAFEEVKVPGVVLRIVDGA